MHASIWTLPCLTSIASVLRNIARRLLLMDIAERRPTQCRNMLLDEHPLGIFRPRPHVLQILGHLFERRRQQGKVARDPHDRSHGPWQSRVN